MKIYAILAIVIVALFVAGCATAPIPSPTTINNVVNTAKDVQQAAQSTETKPKVCTEAIGYQVLIDALPKTVNGFVGDTPQGNMLTFTNPTDQTVMKYSTASVNLVNADKNIEVSATDTCYIQYLSMAWSSYFESEGTDGYFKKTTISGFPGWHQYSKSGESYSYNIFVSDRVIVTVQGSNGVADSDVTAAVNAINFASISAAATAATAAAK